MTAMALRDLRRFEVSVAHRFERCTVSLSPPGTPDGLHRSLISTRSCIATLRAQSAPWLGRL